MLAIILGILELDACNSSAGNFSHITLSPFLVDVVNTYIIS